FKYLCQCILKGFRGEALEAEGRRFMETFFDEPLDEYYYQASLKSAWALELRNHPERFDAQGNYVYSLPDEKPDFDIDLSDVEPESVEIDIAREPYRPLTDDDLELLKAKTKELEYLIRPWLTKGSITQVYGYTGHGKSTMLYRILYHLCVGRDFGRLFQIERPAKVLYFDWENSPHTMV
ncbi:AAA family ATPase, partial [Aeromonas veronii]